MGYDNFGGVLPPPPTPRKKLPPMCGYQHPGSKKVFKEEKTVTNVSRSKREGYLRTVKGGMEQRSEKWGPKEKKLFFKKKVTIFSGEIWGKT